jgi:hypothetical protein
MKHAVLEKRTKFSLYMALAFAVSAAIIGILSLIVVGIPESAMVSLAIPAIAFGYYAVGLKNADSEIYKSESKQSKATIE